MTVNSGLLWHRTRCSIGGALADALSTSRVKLVLKPKQKTRSKREKSTLVGNVEKWGATSVFKCMANAV